ncbi:ATP-binding cassette domain-containing protein [Aurantimonas sp. VKM B-3413]|uniref:ATP-binding cassette domain-containing protein n=1 Tax=Aurantimonas sp. VKM B-3413 TaxID=2779401 RepID=UPI001E45D79D|nr:ATP-binding cassette domain-containing protein [Aurantimonas sp. VKM B-3413]MCB8838074.1 ATP-binding cassette domain-containing protein [Aurantimonas sp. VKM B-3413]
MTVSANANPGQGGAATERSADPFVRIRGLTKKYGGHFANDSINLDIYPNEVLALVGDNGAGKSTFIKMISGVHRPTSGSIRIDGRDRDLHSPQEARNAGIETLHQNLALVDVFTVQENIFMGRELQRRIAGVVPALDHAEMRRRTEALFEELGLPKPDLTRPVRALSGGQRQAVGIARLLLDSDVRLLIMDEPMAALGVEESRLVLDLIERLKARGFAVLIISHNLDHVFQIADRIAILKTGRMVGAVERDEVEHDVLVHTIVGGRLPEHLSHRNAEHLA